MTYAGHTYEGENAPAAGCCSSDAACLRVRRDCQSSSDSDGQGRARTRALGKGTVCTVWALCRTGTDCAVLVGISWGLASSRYARAACGEGLTLAALPRLRLRLRPHQFRCVKCANLARRQTSSHSPPILYRPVHILKRPLSLCRAPQEHDSLGLVNKSLCARHVGYV